MRQFCKEEKGSIHAERVFQRANCLARQYACKASRSAGKRRLDDGGFLCFLLLFSFPIYRAKQKTLADDLERAGITVECVTGCVTPASNLVRTRARARRRDRK